ncbi:oleate hydratase [Roseibacterium sp. SDUM158016]|uniref:oleate hydratase n=1 Tax=Roseicyclus sediminis TaxID=2980997 RepID=UPI0021CFB17E|nr:oleate hydratase [Roseibacterium sp. SDUM158016]MCU4652655.1 oleate hydratase [Roseibacterium sp. SDUM158016]
MLGGGRHVFVGGGIASLAGAALLLRDHGVRGTDIVILEASPQIGGSLDATPYANDLYLMRGARMFEAHYVCMLDLLGAIPSPDGSGNSLRDDLIAFNEEHRVPYAFDQLVDGRILGRHSGGLRSGQLAAFLRMMVAPEGRLDGLKISQCLPRSYFDSEHWLAASTVFAFQPWHSAAEFRRYMRRFLHFVMPPEVRTPVFSTRYNQRDSIIAPLHDWLLRSGVEIRTASRATDARFEQEGSGRRIVEILTEAGPFTLGGDDRAYLTLGSMIDGAAIGAPNEPPPAPPGTLPAWEFWEQVSRRAPGFGRPDAFRADRRRTEWQSFTITLHDGNLGAHLAGLRPAGAHPSALVALAGSPWRLSILQVEQPHFRDQAAGTEVIWGYGLRPDLPGRFCGVPMTEATGRQILDEIAGFLRLDGGERSRVFGDATVIGCRMPMITSQFLPRRRGDRPAVHPEGALNYACIGQFVELPDDTVFTVEYSVRSAWHAVASLNKGGPEPPGVVHPDRDLALIARALRYALRPAPSSGKG